MEVGQQTRKMENIYKDFYNNLVAIKDSGTTTLGLQSNKGGENARSN